MCYYEILSGNESTLFICKVHFTVSAISLGNQFGEKFISY